MAQSPGREEGDADGVSSLSSNSFTLSEPSEHPSSELSTISNTTALSEDLKTLTSCPDLCDVIFLVGQEREPVYAVKAILCARSKSIQKLIQTQSCITKKPHRKLSDVKPPNIKSGLGNLRLFNRRASDTGHLTSDAPVPLLNSGGGGGGGGGGGAQVAQVVIEEFEPEVFRKLVQYLHTGTVTLEPRSLIGLINAAEQYSLDELVLGCSNYMRHCVNVYTVCDLLLSAEKYIHYKTTKVYIQKVMDFIAKNAESVLVQQQLTELPRHVLSLVLSREDIHACATTKFNAALVWSRAQVSNNPEKELEEVFAPFLDVIPFIHIPAATLMKEVKPLGIVPDKILMGALAYQADPGSVPPPTSGPGSRRPSGRFGADDESIGSTTDLQEEMKSLSLKPNAI